jgi:hypothetical protein
MPMNTPNCQHDTQACSSVCETDSLYAFRVCNYQQKETSHQLRSRQANFCGISQSEMVTYIGSIKYKNVFHIMTGIKCGPSALLEGTIGRSFNGID